MKIQIIGAGLTGLILARMLVECDSDSLQVGLIEKSRGVGGRMATRRTHSAKFDHGAQFYARRDPLEAFHQRWQAKSISQYWFDRENVAHFCAASGMTALAKDIGEGLDIQFEQRVVSICSVESRWQINFESGESSQCDLLIFTAPLPQSLEILRRSAVEYDSLLDNIQYSKAIVALVELEAPSEKLGGSTGYQEFVDQPLFSVANQMHKGVSKTPAFTITLSDELSERLFESDDPGIVETVTDHLSVLDPQIRMSSMDMKKWRYNKPLTTYGSLFCEVTPSLFLAGDAFGGASLNGTARSAKGLFEHLMRERSGAANSRINY